MTTDTSPITPWVTSSFSTGGNDCVQVARTRSGRLVRDSKDPDGHKLAVPAASWEAFLDGIRRGTFDLPDHG
jgi:hypothetical protein